MATLSASELRVFQLLRRAILDSTAVLLRLRLRGQERACLGAQERAVDGSIALSVFGLLLTPQERDELERDMEHVLAEGTDDPGVPDAQPETWLPAEVRRRCVVLDEDATLDSLYEEFGRLVEQAQSEPASGLHAQFADPMTGRVYTLQPMLHTFAHPADEALEEGACPFCGQSLEQVDEHKKNTDDEWWACPKCGAQWADGGRFRPAQKEGLS